MADASRFPQGVVIDGSLLVARPVGTLVWDTGTQSLYRSTNAAVATYQQITATSSATATTAGDGVKFLKQRVQVADLTAAAGSQTANWDNTIPANSIIIGTWFYRTTVFAGGGSASSTLSCAIPGISGGAFLDLEDMFTGATVGAYINVLSGSQNLGVDAASIFVGVAPIAPQWTIASNVNVNLLTTGDVTAYVAYTTGSGITVWP